MARRLSGFERACIALIAAGFAVRLLIFHHHQVGYDGAWYLTMGKSLVEEHEFVSPWLANVTYTQHYPPAYPALDAVGYAIGGASYTTAAIVSLAVSLFLVGSVLFATWDLYGRARGLAAAAIVATFPLLIELDRQMLSESLVVAFFALTIWAILKSLDDPRFIVLGGLFAGLGYLTKASMGPFFLLAGAGGFAWRFAYVRWRVFRDKWYMLAACVFALFVIPWAIRNVVRHGWPHWETQAHASDAIDGFFARHDWPILLGQEMLWGLVILLAFALPFLPEIARSLRRIREERTSALWLAVVTPSLIGLIFAAAFDTIEGRTLIGDSTLRYLVTPIVPLLWLGIREIPFGDDAPTGRPSSGHDLVRGRAAFLALGVGIVAFLLFADPTHPFLSTPRIAIFVTGSAIGLGLVLIARAYAWAPATRAGTTAWRATPAPIAGAPGAWLAVGAFGLALLVGLGIEQSLLALMLPLAISLAAGSARARVIALAACAVVAPLSAFQADAPAVRAAEDLNALAAHGDIVSVQPGFEPNVYPLLRSDIKLVTPERPHRWVLAFNDGGDPEPFTPNATLVKTYEIRYVAGPGAAVGIRLWGAMLNDEPETPHYALAALYLVNASAPAR